MSHLNDILGKAVLKRAKVKRSQYLRLGGKQVNDTVGCLILPPCLSRVFLELMAQNCIQTVPEYLKMAHGSNRTSKIFPGFMQSWNIVQLNCNVKITLESGNNSEDISRLKD